VDAVIRFLITVFAAATVACATAPYPVAFEKGPAATPQAQPAPPAQRPPAPAAAQPAGPTATLPKDEDSVKFLVIGDTGTGSSRQYDVGRQIAEAYKRFPFEFAIMLGDNLYGSEGPSAYVNKFERPYKPLLDAGVKFYAALGNHDEPAQRFYEPFNMGGKRYYNFSKGDVEFFVLDSTYMTPAQVEWLKGALEGSRKDWKIAYFHHPIYSSGKKHGSEMDLQALVEPLFLQNGVDVVFAGHEHFYERLKPQKGIVYITQGGGAKLREGNIRAQSALTAKGFDTDQSFTLVEIVDDQMFVETISRRGQVVDSSVIPRREVAQSAGT
jgi:predicted phosphodiesterase